MFLSSRIPSVCSTACILTSPTRTSTSSELARARWTVMELFMMDRHQLQQAAALVIMLDIHPFRHTSTARSRWPASSRRAAAAARRSARGPHAPRSSPRARTAATSAASEETNGIREANTAGSLILSPCLDCLANKPGRIYKLKQRLGVRPLFCDFWPKMGRSGKKLGRLRSAAETRRDAVV